MFGKRCIVFSTKSKDEFIRVKNLLQDNEIKFKTKNRNATNTVYMGHPRDVSVTYYQVRQNNGGDDEHPIFHTILVNKKYEEDARKIINKSI